MPLSLGSIPAILGQAMFVLNDQSPALFLLASEKLDGHYRHARGDKVLTSASAAGVHGQAIFTDVAPGIKAELSLWFDRRHASGGRTFLRNVFHVLFVEWDCRRATAVTRESNVDAQRALAKLGFKFEAALEAWYGDEAGWMFRLLREECRWL
jgi:RimJ/RimL family protein N-acetyltransferase